MAKADEIAVAVVGAGGWGRNHVRVFSRLRGARLHVVCDRDEKVLDGVRRDYPSTQTTSSFEEVIGSPDVQAVVLATPAPLHARMAIAALAAGKHVFVEKPFALTEEEATSIIQAKGPKQTLMVGHLLLFHPVVEKLKQLLASGELGEVRYIYTQRLNLGVVRRDESAWWSLAPHDISTILHLLEEEPVEVQAQGASYITPGVHDVTFANLRFPSGRIAHIHVSWLDPHKERKLVIVGTKKMAVFDDMEPTEKLRLYDKTAELNRSYQQYADWITIRSGDIVIPNVRAAEPLILECTHFIECIKNGTDPITGGESGRRVTRILAQVDAALSRSSK